MTKMSVEIQGSADEVIGVLRRLGIGGNHAALGDAPRSNGEPADGVGEITPAAGAQDSAMSEEEVAGEWTEALARDFLSGLQPGERRMALEVWRAGAAGIHRSVLCQRAELTPPELRSLLMRMGHALRRLQQGAGDDVVPAGGGQQPAAELLRRCRFRGGGGFRDVRRWSGGPDGRWRGSPLTGSRCWAPGEPAMHCLRNALVMMVLVLMALACVTDADERMVRKYAECMTDPNTALHRMTVSGAVGTVALSADAVEEGLRARMLRGEVTMAEIRAGHARHCE